ncbi:CAMK protein kinase [Paracoccidioides brasiliensis]|nr:CAMK protein kinase [Paracoccidioides brasiliensis]
MATFSAQQTPFFSNSANHVGILHVWNSSGGGAGSVNVYSDQEIIIGRSNKLCNLALEGDLGVSNKHIRIYVIIFDQGNPGEVGPLVYAQDMSRNGTRWNGVHIKKEDAGVLLSDGDRLGLTPNTIITFQTWTERQRDIPFSEVQKKEMQHFERRYRITNRLLGCGAYGRVHMAISTKHRKQLACKIIDIGSLKRRLSQIEVEKRTELHVPRPAADVDAWQEIEKIKDWAERRNETSYVKSKLQVYKREVEILKDLFHPNIICLEKVFLSTNTIYIFQELVTAGDLFSFLEFKQFNLSDLEAAVIVRQIALAIRYLHRNNVVHRDIKPDNVLMTSLSDGARVVLTDFGCARRLENESSRMKTSMGTLEYTAPEVPRSTSPGRGIGYTKAVDMWSLGCLTVVLLTGGSPFTHPETGKYSEDMALNCDLSTLEKEEDWQHVGRRAKDFVRNLLILDDNARMTAHDAVSHAWFTSPTYKEEFEKLYRRAVKDWHPRLSMKHQVVSDENIEDGICTKLTHWRKVPETPMEWPYKPYPNKIHRILYPGKQPGKDILARRDEKKEKRIYPWRNDDGPHERAGSPTFSDIEKQDVRRMPLPSDVEEGENDNADTAEKAEAESIDSSKPESSIEPAQINDSDNDHGEEMHDPRIRIRMPFSPDAWNGEQKVREQQYQLPDPLPIPPAHVPMALPYMPQSPSSAFSLNQLNLAPHEILVLSPAGNTNNENGHDGITQPLSGMIKSKAQAGAGVDEEFVDLAQRIQLLDAYNRSHDDAICDIKNTSNHNHNRHGGIGNGGGILSPSPVAPMRRKRDIYDFQGDDEVFEEIVDRITGRKRRVPYGREPHAF